MEVFNGWPFPVWLVVVIIIRKGIHPHWPIMVWSKWNKRPDFWAWRHGWYPAENSSSPPAKTIFMKMVPCNDSTGTLEQKSTSEQRERSLPHQSVLFSLSISHGGIVDGSMVERYGRASHGTALKRGISGCERCCSSNTCMLIIEIYWVEYNETVNLRLK